MYKIFMTCHDYGNHKLKIFNFKIEIVALIYLQMCDLELIKTALTAIFINTSNNIFQYLHNLYISLDMFS